MVRKGSTNLKGLGIKFGATVRKRYGKVYRTLHKKRRCPSCGSLRFGRLAAGIWQCPKCKFVYFYSHTEQTLSEGLRPKT